MSAADIIARVSISACWRSLGGGELRRSGQGKYRGRAWWREGDGWSVSLDDSRSVWRDHRDSIGGGVLDLITHIRGGDRQEALKWLASTAGIALDDHPLTAEDRAAWAKRQREIEHELPAARRWRRAAISMGEQVLAQLKPALHDVAEVANMERFLACIRNADGEGLLEEYRLFRAQNPVLAEAMVKAIATREQAERGALSALWDELESQRGMIGVRAKHLFEEEARERQKLLAGMRPNTKSDLQANLPEPEKGQARDKAAAMVNVSPRTVEAKQA